MDSLAVAGLVVGALGTIAAGLAAGFAALAPTRKDLKRVEDNTAQTSARVGQVETHIKSVDDRLKAQHAREMIEAAARKVSISVVGNQEFSQPMQLEFVVAETDVTLLYIELLNESGALFGSASCVATPHGTFTASLEDAVARRWYHGGAIHQSVAHRLVIRAHIKIKGQEARRDFVVFLRDILKQVPQGGMGYSLTLQGDC